MISQFINSNASLLTQIIIHIQIITAGVLILNFAILIITSNFKRGLINSDLYNKYMELALKYDRSLSRINKKVSWTCIICLIVLYLITNQSVINFFAYYINKYKDFFALIFGAFLASVFGLLSSIISKRHNRRSNIVKSSRLLCNDLLYIIDTLKELAENKGIKIYKKIKYNENWRDNYSEISNVLTNEHYKTIVNIYETIDIINEILDDQENLISVLDDTVELMNMLQCISPQYSLTISDVIFDLERLCEHKRPKNISLDRFLSEIKIIRFCKKYSSTIQDEIIYSRIHEELTVDQLLKYVKNINNKKLSGFQLKRALNIVISNSQKYRIENNRIVLIKDGLCQNEKEDS